jgi:two-component system, OmpR family, phosphate regulon sensor histidine kinase PhoR
VKLSIRLKIFLVLFIIIIIGLGITALVLSHYLKNNIVYRIEGELARQAMLGRAVIYKTDDDITDITSMDRLADMMGKACSARVTVILENGRVVGDSELTREEVRAIENHGDRAEVKRALALGFGKEVRYSTTLESDMVYVAVPFEKQHIGGVIRIAKPLSEVAEAIGGLRRILVGASFIGLLIAALFSLLSSHLFSRRLQRLVNYAEQLVGGEKKQRIQPNDSDELGGIAGSLNKLSAKLEEHVSALAEERDQFEAVLDAMSETVMALDSEGHVTLINRAGIMLLGITGEPVGKMLLEAARIPALHEIVKAEGKGDELTREFDLPGEKVRRIMARVTKLRDGGVLLVLQDVTELRRLERVRRDFVSNVSHELRTPVSIIQANAETLRDGAIHDVDAATRFLDAMIKSTNRLSNLISDLLDISRIEEGKYTLTLESIPLNITLRRAAAALETKAMERNFTISVEPTGSLCAKADVRALDQVLFNLVDNAVKYAGQGGAVIVRAVDEEDTVRIEIIDNGPGIDSRYRERLFERFFRVDKGRSREMGGTGLGLAIVKHLVSAMGGTVGMEPARGGGSLFWVRLHSGES